MHPRAYGIQFEVYAGTSGFAFTKPTRWSSTDGFLNFLNRSIELFGDYDIPKHYNKT